MIDFLFPYLVPAAYLFIVMNIGVCACELIDTWRHWGKCKGCDKLIKQVMAMDKAKRQP